MPINREQYEALERVVNAIQGPSDPGDYATGWTTAIHAVMDAIQKELVLRVEVAPGATATATIS